MPLFDLTDFFKLSSALNYNLSAATLNRYNVLRYITDNKRLDDDENKDREKRSIVMEALGYLFSAYRQKRRHLGPMAVLHPLRAAALYTRSRPSLDLVELLTLLFHDILEDVKPGQFSVQEWSAMEEQFYGLFGKMSPEDETRLTENMLSLTRRDNETYYQYVARLVENSHNSSEIVEIKLADRLDNTLDLRIDLEDSLSGIDFFENIFQIMFVNSYKGYVPKVEHAPASAINGAKRLYQLFKNAVLLSLIRLYASDSGQWSQKLLFDAVAEAGLNEAQRTLIHLISYHVKDVSTQRGLLLEVMQYCYSGRSNLVTKPDGSQLLDGLFSTYFGHKSSQMRRQQLAILYQNKNLMMEAAVGFIVIFLNFLNDEKYYIQGISAQGIEPR